MTGNGVVHVGHSLQLLVGAVFFVAAVSKLRQPSQFVAAVRGYDLIPSGLSLPLAAIVLATELFVAGSFFTGWALNIGVVVANVLLIVFAAAVGTNLRRGHFVSCGCFGSPTEQISWRTLGRIGLLALAVIGLAAVRLLGTPLPGIWNLVTDVGGVQQLALSTALASLLAVVGTWLLHLPELKLIFGPVRIEPERSVDV